MHSQMVHGLSFIMASSPQIPVIMVGISLILLTNYLVEHARSASCSSVLKITLVFLLHLCGRCARRRSERSPTPLADRT